VNAAFCWMAGLLLEQHKRLLPFYDVFDEQRYFPHRARSRWSNWTASGWPSPSARTPGTTRTSGRAASTPVDPMEELMRQQPAVHINLSSSPFWHGKRAIRREMLAAIARRDGIPVLMCNQVGGNDSLIFDGSSLALNARGELIAQAASFRGRPGGGRSLRRAGRPGPEDDDTEAAYRALVLGTRDYVRKCGFARRWWA
jgi:NAD+ synthase (glutamine-hydrolysing)